MLSGVFCIHMPFEQTRAVLSSLAFVETQPCTLLDQYLRDCQFMKLFTVDVTLAVPTKACKDHLALHAELM